MVIRKQPKSGKVSVTGKGGKEIDTGQEKTREEEEEIARPDEWKE